MDTFESPPNYKLDFPLGTYMGNGNKIHTKIIMGNLMYRKILEASYGYYDMGLMGYVYIISNTEKDIIE